MMDPGQRATPRLGLPVLGLLMQLSGLLWIFFNITILIMTLMLPTTTDSWVLPLIFTLGLVRSITHVLAGARLATSNPDAGGTLRVYVIASVIHTLITALVISKAPLPRPTHLPLLALLTVWPLAVSALPAWPRFHHEMTSTDPLAGWSARRALASVMLAFSLAGLGWSLTVIAPVFDKRSTTPGVLIMLVLVLLGARSGAQLYAAISGLNARNGRAFVSHARAYGGWGIALSFVVLVPFFSMMGDLGKARPGVMATVMCEFALLLLCLASWPRLVLWFTSRQLSPETLFEAPTDAQPHDAPASTGMGWLLVMFGSLGFVATVLSIATDNLPGPMAMLLGATHATDRALFALCATLQLAAGASLITSHSLRVPLTVGWAALRIAMNVKQLLNAGMSFALFSQAARMDQAEFGVIALIFTATLPIAACIVVLVDKLPTIPNPPPNLPFRTNAATPSSEFEPPQ